MSYSLKLSICSLNSISTYGQLVSKLCSPHKSCSSMYHFLNYKAIGKSLYLSPLNSRRNRSMEPIDFPPVHPNLSSLAQHYSPYPEKFPQSWMSRINELPPPFFKIHLDLSIMLINTAVGLSNGLEVVYVSVYLLLIF